MNELLARLVDLSYEFFGVLMPGVIATLFLCLWWAALGQLAPSWTSGVVPELDVDLAASAIQSFSNATSLAVIILILIVWYLIGHLILWFARSGKSDDKARNNWLRRVALTLIFQTPKPKDHYRSDLKPLFNAIAKKLGTRGSPLNWGQLYPVARCLLSQRLNRSLVTTYQNKYTLHRSIATAAAGLFWLCLLTIIGAAITLQTNGPQPHWMLLTAFLVGAGSLAAVFSESYMYHWGLFGDTVVTETYSLLYGPIEDEPKR